MLTGNLLLKFRWSSVPSF